MEMIENNVTTIDRDNVAVVAMPDRSAAVVVAKVVLVNLVIAALLYAVYLVF